MGLQFENLRLCRLAGTFFNDKFVDILPRTSIFFSLYFITISNPHTAPA